MSKRIILKNARMVNEGRIFEGDMLISGGRIQKIASSVAFDGNAEEVDLNGMLLMPGCIDDQVHFREPGLTHKADIFSESRAAAAGGITSFMEMPNTVPNTLTQELLEEKYLIASKTSVANYSFFMGASNDNIDEVLKTDATKVCGVKVFMGSSTGNMLVDNEETLNGLFSRVPMLIATHCEDEATIRKNMETAREKYGEEVPIGMHPLIRSEEACYLSSSMAVRLAKKHGSRLHVLHLSTAKELELFDNTIALKDKKITAEACVHHMWFSDDDYEEKGTLIKWNPAVKTANDRDAIVAALMSDHIDIIATDHAPHTLEEKQQTYFKAPSGGPLVQHALPAMLELVDRGKITLEKVVEKMAHAPAVLYRIKERGFLREGYYADLVVVNPNETWTVNQSNILYKCAWSPFEGTTFGNKVFQTYVNGELVYDKGSLIEGNTGSRLYFEA